MGEVRRAVASDNEPFGVVERKSCLSRGDRRKKAYNLLCFSGHSHQSPAAGVLPGADHALVCSDSAVAAVMILFIGSSGTDPGLLVYLAVDSKLALPYVFDMCDFFFPSAFLSPLAEKIKYDLLPCSSAVQHWGCLPIELISKSKENVLFSQVIFVPYRKLSFSILLSVFFDLSA